MRDPWCNLRINPWENIRFRALILMAPCGCDPFPGLGDKHVRRVLSQERDAEFTTKRAGFQQPTEAGQERGLCEIWNIGGYWKHCPALFGMATRTLVSPLSGRTLMPWG
jgi:hypothetical protein